MSGREQGTRHAYRTVDTLVLALFVDVVEVPQHFDGADVGACIINHPFATVLH